MTISGFTGSEGSLLVAVTSNEATPVSPSLALITATCTSLPFGGQRVVPVFGMPWIVGGLVSEDGPSVRLAPLNPNPRENSALIPDASVLKLNSVEKPVLCWSDSDLDERICDDCAECLVKAEHTLLKLNLDRPSPELIDRNP
jgi:hypothetical protein